MLLHIARGITSNIFIFAWMFLQVSCSSTFLYLKSSLRYWICWSLTLIRLRVLETDFLEATNFSKFRAPKKLKLDWLARGMGSDSFTIHDERIQRTHE